MHNNMVDKYRDIVNRFASRKYVIRASDLRSVLKPETVRTPFLPGSGPRSGPTFLSLDPDPDSLDGFIQNPPGPVLKGSRVHKKENTEKKKRKKGGK